MAPTVGNLDSLAAELSRLSTVEDKMLAFSKWGNAQQQGSPSVRLHSNGQTSGTAEGATTASEAEVIHSLLAKNGLTPQFLQQHLLSEKNIVRSNVMLGALPCANHRIGVPTCGKPGTLTCSGCKLVRYCSAQCQKSHWTRHKRDCKAPMMAHDWKPDWVKEQRVPSFVANAPLSEGEDWRKRNDRLDRGLSLWGNMPAIDILNHAAGWDEAMYTNCDVAFVASGDLRNVVQAVNGLPNDFTGQLSITINDCIPHVSLRNILLLLILGKASNVDRAADIALHVWYSAFLPTEYHTMFAAQAVELVTGRQSDSTFSFKLGSRSSLDGVLDRVDMKVLGEMMTAEYSVAAINEEMHRVHFAPHRLDNWHRRCCQVEPAHRMALLEHRRFGLVYPFGAPNYHFNTPNRTLFSHKGEWLQSDHADPLESWDIKTVLEAGKRHGAVSGDLYGCLYFYLGDQLRTFAQRLSTFRIKFHVFCDDASTLSKQIRDGTLSRLLPTNQHFDRVEVSNTLDTEYIGIPKILSDWGPLLKHNKSAAIVGYFMNWTPKQFGSSITNCSPKDTKDTTDKMVKLGRLTFPSLNGSAPNQMIEAMAQMFGGLSDHTSVLENSSAFAEYLRKHGMDDGLRKHKLRLRRIHQIVPHRLCTPIGAKPQALPEFSTDEDWYLHSNLGHWLWSERFVEIERAL